jgi:outer membrane protein assembly factor BamB
MLAALEAPYDFLSATKLPPPVGPLADALAAMGERRSAPLLAKHLNDPATAIEDVVRAAKALSVLATADELPALRTFFALYRATADDPPLIQAVVSVAEALVKIGGSDGRAIVQRAAKDPMTQPDVARALGTLAPG